MISDLQLIPIIPYMLTLKQFVTGTIAKIGHLFKGLQAYLPIDAIQFKLQNSPHQLKQESPHYLRAILKNLTERLLGAGLPQSYIEELLKTEIYINRKDLIRRCQTNSYQDAKDFIFTLS